jgi:hypothetical protein
LSLATLYKLKAKYSGMDLSHAKRLMQLEDENAKLKRLLAGAKLLIVPKGYAELPSTTFTVALS